MARNSEDREDILREATALVERVELQLEDWPEPVVIGFRRAIGPAFFFGADPVYQFNDAHQLRRAFQQGNLLKADKGKLVELSRHRTEAVVKLVSRTLDENEAGCYLAELSDNLRRLATVLAASQFVLLGQIPEQSDVIGRLSDWLAELPEDVAVAERPHA